MRIRQIKLDQILFTTDNARVWNNQLSPYYPPEIGGIQTNKETAISQSWREEIGERAFANTDAKPRRRKGVISTQSESVRNSDPLSEI